MITKLRIFMKSWKIQRHKNAQESIEYAKIYKIFKVQYPLQYLIDKAFFYLSFILQNTQITFSLVLRSQIYVFANLIKELFRAY